jgi:hypothetical protein
MAAPDTCSACYVGTGDAIRLNVGVLPLKMYRQDHALSLAVDGHPSQFFPDADCPATVDHSVPLRTPFAGLRSPKPFHVDSTSFVRFL